MRYVQRRERGSHARVLEFLAARRKGSRRRVPLDTFDVPPMASQSPFLRVPAIRRRPDALLHAHDRVVVGHGEALVVWREIESTYGLSMCGLRDEVIHDGL
jgi:hypothetical protein